MEKVSFLIVSYFSDGVFPDYFALFLADGKLWMFSQVLVRCQISDLARSDVSHVRIEIAARPI